MSINQHQSASIRINRAIRKAMTIFIYLKNKGYNTCWICPAFWTLGWRNGMQWRGNGQYMNTALHCSRSITICIVFDLTETLFNFNSLARLGCRGERVQGFWTAWQTCSSSPATVKCQHIMWRLLFTKIAFLCSTWYVQGWLINRRLLLSVFICRNLQNCFVYPKVHFPIYLSVHLTCMFVHQMLCAGR